MLPATKGRFGWGYHPYTHGTNNATHMYKMMNGPRKESGCLGATLFDALFQGLLHVTGKKKKKKKQTKKPSPPKVYFVSVQFERWVSSILMGYR